MNMYTPNTTQQCSYFGNTWHHQAHAICKITTAWAVQRSKGKEATKLAFLLLEKKPTGVT